jgi:signal transduction histidine kinase
MKTIRIDFNVDDTVSSLEALLLRLFGRGGMPRLDDDVTLDCSLCGYLGPIAVATLCALRRAASSRGLLLEMIPPQSVHLLAYCAFCGLLGDFGIGPPAVAHPESVTTVVRQFDTAPLQAQQEIVDLARYEVGLSKVDEGNLKLALAELTQNVLDHSKSGVGGFLSARAFKNVRDLRFVVADLGIGFRQSLKNKHVIRSDRDAIALALQERVSGQTLKRNMGMGLSLLQDVVRRNGGELMVYSGQGALVDRNGRVKITTPRVAYPGSLASVRLRMNEPNAVQLEDGEEDVWA